MEKLSKSSEKVGGGGGSSGGLIVLFVALLTLIPAMVFSITQWVPLPGGSPTPEPPEIEVIDHNDDHTIIQISIPGFWVEDVVEGGETYKRVYVDDYGTTSIIGRPSLPVIRELLGVPFGVDIDIDMLSKNTEQFTDYLIYPVQIPYPISGEPYDFYIDEDFYQTSNPYPQTDVENGVEGVMRDIRGYSPVINPFRCIPADEVLNVAYQMVAEVTYTERLGDAPFEENPPTVEATDDIDLMYQYSFLNYDYLNIHRVDDLLAIYDYLIIKPRDFSYDFDEYITYLLEKGLTPKVVDFQGAEGDYETLKSFIDYEFNNKNIRYVLLIDAGPDQQPGQKDMPLYPCPGSNGEPEKYNYRQSFESPADYPYACVDLNCGTEDEDWFPDVFVGRLCVEDGDELTEQFEKIFEYSGYSNLQQKALLCAHKDPDKKCCFHKNKIYTFRRYYEYPPDFVTVYGDEPGNNNSVLKLEIEAGVDYVNYLGHGDFESWCDWNITYPEQDWTTTDVHNLNNPRLMVVFNIDCRNAQIWSGESICEAWMNADRGAVATFGATASLLAGGDYGTEEFDQTLFKRIFRDKYSETVIESSNLSPIIESCIFWDYLVYPLSEYKTENRDYGEYQSQYENYIQKYSPGQGQVDTRGSITFGDPSLELKIGDVGTIDNPLTSSLDVQDSTPFKLNSVYPSPVDDETINVGVQSSGTTVVSIEIYDITGRIISSKERSLQEGENILDISTNDLKNGVYLMRIISDEHSESARFVVVR